MEKLQVNVNSVTLLTLVAFYYQAMVVYICGHGRKSLSKRSKNDQERIKSNAVP
jgi:hypothetical protein